jgi:hypothetical protein
MSFNPILAPGIEFLRQAIAGGQRHKSQGIPGKIDGIGIVQLWVSKAGAKRGKRVGQVLAQGYLF